MKSICINHIILHKLACEFNINSDTRFSGNHSYCNQDRVCKQFLEKYFLFNNNIRRKNFGKISGPWLRIGMIKPIYRKSL